MRVCIAGIMGSGKSHFGPKLAQVMGLGYADLDAMIVEREGRSIASIFTLDGEAYFRRVETEMLREALRRDGIVISLGGGTPCFGSNLELIKEHSILLWLNLPAAVIAQRVFHNRQSRPLIAHCETIEAVEETIGQMLEHRRTWYAQAHLEVTDPDARAEHVASEIRQLHHSLFTR